jgi:hypothetical protein
MSKRKNRKTKAGIPDLSDRISVDQGGSVVEAMRGLFSNLTWISALFPFAVYEVMDDLFKTEPYFAKFKRDTLSLGNSGHEIEIDAATEQKAKAVLQIVNDFAARCYPGAGADGLFNGLFSQLCRAGGLCVEVPPLPDRSGIKRGYLVRMRSLRFRYGSDGELELGQIQSGQFVPLNPVQTAFIAAETFDENPYPIPPALAALSATATNQKFEEGIRAWTKKVGSFGLLQASAERPEMLETGESQEEYWRRTQTMLRDFTQSIAKNMQEGVAAAWDNVEFKFTNTNAGAAGAKDMAQTILQSLFAGLLRDPVFFGHNWGTTETFASVVYRIMASQIKNFQLCVKRAYEHALRLELALKGMGDIGVSVRFNLTDTLDEFMASEASAMERAQFVNEFNSLICSLEEVREKLGYDDANAKSGAFIASFEKKAGSYSLKLPKPRWNGFDFGKSSFTSKRSIEAITADYSAREARRAAREYVYQVQGKLSDAARLGVEAVYEWASVRDIPEVDTFVAEALRLFLSGAEDRLDARTLERIGREHLDRIWTWARYEDDSVFGGEWKRSAPGKAVTGTWDTTAIGYMSRVDRFYTSKYVSGDDRTNQQITDFLREQYLEKGLGRGKSPKELAAFREEFSELAEKIGEHRARVIIDTGVSRAQNWGQMLALHDEQITTFRIAGPWDRLTCDWCKAMRNKEFTVSKEITRIERIIESGNEDISKFDKFITSRFAGKDGLKSLEDMDAADVQATGMVTAPIHPLCRHRVVAVIKKEIA